MTDREFDALLRRALTDNVRARQARVFADGLPLPEHTRRYLRWEKKLLADPFGFARRQARPVWKKALQTAASILLCFAVLFGAVMAVVPSARAWVVERVVYWTDSFTKFSFTAGAAQGLSADWRPTYIPEGFEETQAEWNEGSNTLRLTYENAGGGTIRMVCRPAMQGTGFLVDNEHSDYQEIEINGRPADLLVSNTEGFPSYLLWSSEDGKTALMLTSSIEPGEMVAIAAGGTIR
ncbi:hypothetical protein CE91St41_06660 [Oscillospiraceae bacterium]|nr:hypothetical protein CE91St40_06660 [Oscillospiraceae bacterium]BDF73777.1 hypothetical protein CE91St41_06660 [Oscillospiraceae bacterium]